ncbi:MAG TPA: permease, partial [Candidatus Deferrimicrobium sp.]|nr:permease [Candidatus Deferrimicrobium sp.]
MSVLRSVGDGLAQGFFMFWETLWALVLGFTLSGTVQAFVTRGQMERALGHPGARTLARATFLGMVSSSCSYAATAMAKSLFARGADLTAALVFMIASTNLVIELGIVLALLIGWQFTASELAGGLLMIALFGVASRVILPGQLVAAARQRLQAPVERSMDAPHDSAEAPAGRHEHRPSDAAAAPSSAPLRSVTGWSAAAGYAIADITMLRREMVIGFTVAGLLAALVPDALWAHIFVSGHGFASSLENVLVGPLIAILRVVCSIGNVPLAAALWKGGISFGGVIAFLFADLITLPLLLIYRRYYGGALTLRILVGFWLIMSLSGLAVEGIFGALNIIPSTRPAQIAPQTIALDYTSVLNVIAL